MLALGEDPLAAVWQVATSLREQIADAQRRFELIDRQIDAHGR